MPKTLLCLSFLLSAVLLFGCNEGLPTGSEASSQAPAAAVIDDTSQVADESAESITTAPVADESAESSAVASVADESTETNSTAPVTDKSHKGNDDTVLAGDESAENEEDTAPAAESGSDVPPVERLVTGDWPAWGGGLARNMVNESTGIPLDFQPPRGDDPGRRVVWTAQLGSQTYANPVVAGGKVFVGSNNGAHYRPQYTGDLGVVLCFDEVTGDFLWQLSRGKLPQGRVNDWPEQGICSTPFVEDGRLYVVTNRAEVMCLDVEGFRDGENDGPYTGEADTEEQDADIIWSFDMVEELGVFPHNLATSSPLVYEGVVLAVTSNGVDEAHLELPSPRSPSFIGLNRDTGELVWEDNSPFDQVLHGQWGSPALGVVNGQAQVYMPGGDGWLYALNPLTGEHIWKFDLNPKDSVWELYGRGTRNAIISTPVFHENSVVLAVGQDPEHGNGVGHIYRIDATKTGDVSPEIEAGPSDEGTIAWEANPNSGQIWHWGGVDADGSVTGKEGELIFRRTISSAAIHDGLVYCPDLIGILHCLDFETGSRYWEHDLFAEVWGSPMVVDGKVFIGDQDGELAVMATGREKKLLDEKTFKSSIYSTMTVANGTIYITDRSRLYAFSTE